MYDIVTTERSEILIRYVSRLMIKLWKRLHEGMVKRLLTDMDSVFWLGTKWLEFH